MPQIAHKGMGHLYEYGQCVRCEADAFKERGPSVESFSDADVALLRTVAKGHGDALFSRAADEIDRLRAKIAQVDNRINEVVLGRVMGSTSWLSDALSELRS